MDLPHLLHNVVFRVHQLHVELPGRYEIGDKNRVSNPGFPLVAFNHDIFKKYFYHSYNVDDFIAGIEMTVGYR